MDADSTAHPGPTADARCRGCEARDRRIAQLEAQVGQLKGRLTELEQSLDAARRGGKRQAAPFSKGPPKVDPKTPGRKSGEKYGTKAFRSVPAVIDEEHEAPLPRTCPGCGAGAEHLVETQVTPQYQVEIPRRPIYRKFNVHVGRCTCCGKRVQGRHALQTSDALACCASQVGPDAQAAVVTLNKEMGLPYGKISRVFETLFGIKLTRGGACQIVLRAGDRCADTYNQIVQYIQSSTSSVSDETGWRVCGQLEWLHSVVADRVVGYLIHQKRGFEAMSLLLGADYAGKMTHDGWAAYDRFIQAIHQTCLGHLLRRCKELLETATRGAVIFPRKVKAILQQALAIRDRRDAGAILPATAIRYADRFDLQMEQLLLPTKQHAGNERFAAHLWKHRDELFTFLRHEGVDATNYRAEQAIRPAVVNRKVWGGNRTDVGAAAQAILMSVLGTAAKLGADGLEFVSQTLAATAGNRPTLILTG